MSMESPRLIELSVFEDARGWVKPWYIQSRENFFDVKQINMNLTLKNAFRGFHFGVGPEAQAKLVSCVFGEVVDYVLDVRLDSKDFGQMYKFNLSSENPNAVYIPQGFAHGIYGKAEKSLMVYASTSEWNPSTEITITPFDPDFQLELDLESMICSEKDQKGMLLNDYAKNFRR
jgi:dTDP-4-dehydrorhamnose 3,5-epimerase